MKASNKYEETDFFDHIAEIGSKNITSSDVDDIFNRIDKRVKSEGNALNKNVFSTVLILAFTFILLLTLFHKSAVIQIGPDKAVSLTNEQDIIVKANNIDTIVNEIVVNTDNLENNKEILAQHFTQKNSDVHFSKDIQFENLELKNVSLNDSVVPLQNAENYLELLPNAPYIYIYDLKITDYQTLYFKHQQPYTIEQNGLDAEYENVSSYLQVKKDRTSLLPYTLDALLKDALKLFNKGQYKSANVLFEDLLSYNAKDINALFYAGLCNYYISNSSGTIDKMENVLMSKNNVFHQEAEWYKALALIKLNENQKAIVLLLKISENKGFYAKAAQDKLGEMK